MAFQIQLIRAIALAFAIATLAIAPHGPVRAETLKNRVISPEHYDGPVQTTLTLDDTGQVTRGPILNSTSGNTQWVVRKNGRVVLQRAMNNAVSFRYFGREPGAYKVYLQQFINGDYRIISDVVGYRINRAGVLSGLFEKRKAFPVRHAILQLPLHEEYHEVAFSEVNGRAIYQGDIDLGSVAKVLEKSNVNANRFSTGALNKNLLRLAKDTKFLTLKNQLQVETVDVLAKRNVRGQRSAIRLNPNRLWQGGRVPFEIAPNEFSGSFEAKIFDAVREINDNTVVNIVWKEQEELQGTSQPDDDRFFIRIIRETTPGIGGSSQVGRANAASEDGQQLTLRQGVRKGTIIHEIMHALGFYHTQSRSDRTTHVCVDTQGLTNDEAENFDLQDGAFDVAYGGYDTESIMHYESCAFSTCNSCWLNLAQCATILPRSADNPEECDSRRIGGQRGNMAASDIAAINWLYTNIDALQNGPIDPNAPTRLSAAITRLVTTRGPEENGLGCNDDMDFYANIRIAPVAYDAQRDFFVIDNGAQAVGSFTKIEGNDIAPPGWVTRMPLVAGNRYHLVTFEVKDDDKSGVAGIGACGQNDDNVSVQNVDPRSSYARILVDLEAPDPADQLKIVTAMEHITPLQITNRFRPADTASLNTAFGTAFTLNGRTNASHAANMTATVNLQ